MLFVKYVGPVWFAAYGATPCLKCVGRFGRHTCGAECVARCGAIVHEPNTPVAPTNSAGTTNRTSDSNMVHGTANPFLQC